MNHYQALEIIPYSLRTSETITSSPLLILRDKDNCNAQADELITKMLKAINLNRSEVDIITTDADLTSYRPKVILAFGNTAIYANNLNAQIITTHSPNHLIKNPKDKRKTWTDLQKVEQLLKE